MKFLCLIYLACTLFVFSKAYVQVTDDNFSKLIQKEDEWILKFYADWCTHCKALEPKFQAADRYIGMSTHKHVKLGAVNVDTNPGLSARFFVARLPTLIHIKNREARILPLPKTENDIVSFVTLEEWRNVNPQSGLRSPFSPVGQFFVGYSSKIIRKLSSYSPFTIVSVFTGFLLFTVILPVIITSRYVDLEEEQASDKKAEGDSPNAVTEGKATAKNDSIPPQSRRKSKRSE